MEAENVKLPHKKKIQKQPKEPKQPKQPKKEGQVKEDKIDSVFIARELVFGDEVNLDKWLFQFKKIKSASVDKLSDRILQNLKKSKFTFMASVNRFISICEVANDQNTTGNQMSAVLSGFYTYWRECQVTEEQFFKLFFLSEKVYVHISRKFIMYCRALIQKWYENRLDEFRKEALQMAQRLLKQGKVQQSRILALIYEFDLYGQIPYGRIVDLALRFTNINEALYIFQFQDGKIRENLLKLFVDRCAGSDIKSELTKCETVIRGLKVDPFKYGNYITKIQERYISYLARTYKLYYIELIICHDKKLVSLLVEQLYRMNRGKEASYFIFHYKLEKQFGIQFSKGEIEKLNSMRNILLDNDQFGPTEVEVLEEIQNEEEERNFLYVSDFGVKQTDVIVVDSKNIGIIDYREQFQGKIGIDEERTGGTHVFDPSLTSTFQVFNGQKVFIFDCLELGESKLLKQILKHILTTCSIYGQDIQKELTAIQKEMRLDIDQATMQQLTAYRLFDSSKYFKKVFPKQTKSNLVHLCKYLFKKTVSKFQQCSGWMRRPLRKAQLHYAALDCILPVKICEELARIEGGK